MIYNGNIKNTNNNVTFFNDHNIAKRWKVNILMEKNLLPSVVKLAEAWNVPYVSIIAFIDKNNLLKDCFMYSLYGGEHSRMVAEKGVYTEKVVWSNGRYIMQKNYHNVFIRENTHIHLIFPKIIEYIITTYYPKFVIYEDIPRFDKKINIKPNTSIKEIEREYYNCDLTALDIVNLLTNPKYSLEKVKKLKYRIYGDGDIIFYPIAKTMYKGREYEISLYIPRDAIVKNDWGLVENQRMFSIIKPNAETITDGNIWFEGLQKDSPHFNHKEVAKVKKLFQ